MQNEEQVNETPQAEEAHGIEPPEEPQKNETAGLAMFQGPEAETGPKPYPSFLSHVSRGFWD